DDPDDGVSRTVGIDADAAEERGRHDLVVVAGKAEAAVAADVNPDIALGRHERPDLRLRPVSRGREVTAEPHDGGDTGGKQPGVRQGSGHADCPYTCTSA